jgi:hypothetical protein
LSVAYYATLPTAEYATLLTADHATLPAADNTTLQAADYATLPAALPAASKISLPAASNITFGAFRLKNTAFYKLLTRTCWRPTSHFLTDTNFCFILLDNSIRFTILYLVKL